MPLAIMDRPERSCHSLISLLIAPVVNAVSLGVALWLNCWLALVSVVVRGRMPARFYSASALLAKLQTLASELWRRTRVLTLSLIVASVVLARAAVRHLMPFKAASDSPSTPRTVRGAPMLPWLEHHTVKVHDVKLHYVSAGRSSRRLVLLLHGFPELWYCWRHQLHELGRTEWAVALDLPGFGDSDSPQRSSQYTVDALVPLLQEFIAALGQQQCVLIGSDLGAQLGWHLVMRSPETFTHFVSVSQPLPHIATDILEGSAHWKLKHWRRYLYQLPWLPEWLIASGDLDILSAEYADMRSSGKLQEADLQALQFAFSRPEDWRGPLMHQRQWFSAANAAPPLERISVATLQLFGKRDKSLPLDSMYRSLPHLRDTNIQIIENAGRRPHMEQPEVTISMIQDFIGVSEPEEEEAREVADGSPEKRSIAWKALEGGYGLLGAGSSIFSKTIDKVNHATALGELYTRSVMLMKD